MKTFALFIFVMLLHGSCLADVVINSPQVGGYGLDYCREWAKDCGWPAANAFCQSKGYKEAATFKWVKDNQKTRIINGGQVCDAAFVIESVRLLAKNRPLRSTIPKSPVMGSTIVVSGPRTVDGLPLTLSVCPKATQRAVDFKWAKDNQKTRIINGGQVCDAAFCDRISKVVCEN